ncbi:GTPase [Aeromicrobium terrae]|uniref:ABC transporter n=1 Tax=Aeromicrobium terrae TaxID=2498846 RepID=A0A5C8NLZ7_9ACTN|nr:GTPase [Aeromicrobium terrae]TXL61935.1 ABC transporter [Aeromicrobium terrae]
MTAATDAAAPTFSGARNDVAARLDALVAAIDAAQGRLDPSVLASAESLADRASERLQLSGEHTIVALAGATGSGKSSLFNALTDLELAGVGVRRPTTSWALACAWGPDGAQGLLEWMGIPARHQVSRMSMLDRSAEDQRLDGLVLLDLPDHDSTEVEHHLEMDRLVKYADLLVWVLDPQKYADAAIHDRYIRPMAGFRDVTLVVLNQIDRIPFEQRARALSDVGRILEDEGLEGVPVLGISATRGDGIEELKRELASRIRAKASARERLETDIVAAAYEIATAGGTSQVPGISDVDHQALHLGLLDCAGVPQLVSAIEASTRRRGSQRTGWPVTRWLGRLRPDPLAELGIDPDRSISRLARQTGVPSVASVQRAQAESSIRDIAEKASVGLEGPWRDAVREASIARSDEIVTALDGAVAKADVSVARPAPWWGLVNVLQGLLFLAMIGGLGWLGVLLADRLLDSFEVADPPEVGGFSLPVVMAVGGAVVGIVLGLLANVVGRLYARSRARRAERTLTEGIVHVAEEQVVDPVQDVLDDYARYRTSILKARD